MNDYSYPFDMKTEGVNSIYIVVIINRRIVNIGHGSDIPRKIDDMVLSLWRVIDESPRKTDDFFSVHGQFIKMIYQL